LLSGKLLPGPRRRSAKKWAFSGNQPTASTKKLLLHR
jgi:hypothetical protein